MRPAATTEAHDRSADDHLGQVEVTHHGYDDARCGHHRVDRGGRKPWVVGPLDRRFGCHRSKDVLGGIPGQPERQRRLAAGLDGGDHGGERADESNLGRVDDARNGEQQIVQMIDHVADGVGQLLRSWRVAGQHGRTQRDGTDLQHEEVVVQLSGGGVVADSDDQRGHERSSASAN